ncbi:hypothetical protein C8R48DRAFT_672595 [Suillus tomentosus]|nr:hypothetical protein C8R48DRAFT_672595 [Suillus tomentosus]
MSALTSVEFGIGNLHRLLRDQDTGARSYSHRKDLDLDVLMRTHGDSIPALQQYCRWSRVWQFIAGNTILLFERLSHIRNLTANARGRVYEAYLSSFRDPHFCVLPILHPFWYYILSPHMIKPVSASIPCAFRNHAEKSAIAIISFTHPVYLLRPRIGRPGAEFCHSMPAGRTFQDKDSRSSSWARSRGSRSADSLANLPPFPKMYLVQVHHVIHFLGPFEMVMGREYFIPASETDGPNQLSRTQG